MKLADYEMLDALTQRDYVRAITKLANELAVYPGEAVSLIALANRGEFLFSKQGTHRNGSLPARQVLARCDHVNYIWIQGIGFKREGTVNANSIIIIFEPERHEAG